MILSAALNYVPDYGWSQKAIQLALTAQGLPASAHTLFKRGPGNLIEHFELKCDEELLQYMRNLKIGDNPSVLASIVMKRMVWVWHIVGVTLCSLHVA